MDPDRFVDAPAAGPEPPAAVESTTDGLVRQARELGAAVEQLTAALQTASLRGEAPTEAAHQQVLDLLGPARVGLDALVARLEGAPDEEPTSRPGTAGDDPWKRISVRPPGEQAGRSKAQLLVVDDSELNRMIVTHELSARGYHVVAASHGQEALDLLERTPFDLVLLDVMMPGLSGIEVLEVIRRRHAPADLPVIMVTARDGSDDVVAALEAGANDYVTKPLDVAVGAARIETQLTLKRAKDELEALNHKLIKAQQQLAELAGSAGAVENMDQWASSVAAELAAAVGASAIVVSVLDEGAPTGKERLSDPAVAADLDEVVRSGKPLLRPRHAVFPVLGNSGKIFGALVVLGEHVGWTQTDRHLLESFARQLGGALELRDTRAKLTRAAEQRRVRQLEMLEQGIDLLRVCPMCGRCYDQRVERCLADGAVLPAPRSFPVCVADRYRLERLCGEGGMGTVYRAFDRRLERAVALKVVRAELFNNDTVRHRFEREARAVARIDHPGVVAVYDSGELDDGSLFLVMEWLDGCDLALLLRERGRGTPAEVASLVLQGGAALGAASDAGLVHRDIKPANIFLVPAEGADFRVKLLDFGVAKEIRSDGGLTQTGSLLGTPRYMSPEQLLQRELDGRSDLYSLASVAYEALTGRAVVQAEEFAEVVLEVIRGAPPPVSDFVPAVPAVVDELFGRALAKAVEERPASVRDWSHELAGALDGVGGSAAGWTVNGSSSWLAARSAAGTSAGVAAATLEARGSDLPPRSDSGG